MMHLNKKLILEILFVVVFVLSRLPFLGHDEFNTDVWKWKTRSYDFGSGLFGLEFEKTLQKYHPGVTLMWLGSLGVKIYNLYHETFLPGVSLDSITAVFGLHFVQKFLVVLTIGISLAFLFYVLRILFGVRYALLSCALIALEPFYMALSRTFHLEGMMSTFMLVSVVWFYYFLRDDAKNTKRLLVASFFAALSFLTKTSSLYLLPFFALVLFIFLFKKTKSIKRLLFPFMRLFGKVLLFTFIFVFLLWPALWVSLPTVIDTLYRGVAVVGVENEHIQYYFGKLVEDPGPSFYFVVLAIRSSLYLFVGVILALLLAKKYVNTKNRDFIYYLLIYTGFYVLMLTIPTKKLDRYVLPALLSGLLLVSFSYEYLLQKFKGYLVYLLFFSCSMVTAFYLHPDYFTYFNSLFGGLSKGIYITEPKWLIGEREILAYFKDLKTRENILDAPDKSFEALVETGAVKDVLSVGFPEKYYTQIWPFFREMGSWAVIADLSPFAVHTKYFVYPVWEDDSVSEDRFKLTFMSDIKVQGVTVYKVYKRVD